MTSVDGRNNIESPRLERAEWERMANTEEFRQLLRSKRRFVLPACLFFAMYYFALPVLVGFAPQWMSKKVVGAVNIAYLFALSQFVMAWAIAWLYVRAARRFDRLAARVAEQCATGELTPSA